MNLLHIGNHIYPFERIKSTRLTTLPNGENGYEITLFNVSETFCYTDQPAATAYQLLGGATLSKTAPGPQKIAVTVTINGQPLPAATTIIPEIHDAAGTPLAVTLDGQLVHLADLVWVDLDTEIDGQHGIELRLESDGLATDGTPLTRKYTGDLASQIYDQLTSLTDTETQQAAG